MKKFHLVLLWILTLIVSFFIDKQIVLLITNNRIPTLNNFFIWISFMGTWIFVLIFMTCLLMWEQRKREWVPTLLVSVLTAWLICGFLKILIARPRPEEILNITSLVKSGIYSFPSGHATAVFSTIAILDKEYKKLKWFWISFAILVAFSRLYLGVHYLSDVIAGSLLGYSISYLFVHLEEKQKIFKSITKFFTKSKE